MENERGKWKMKGEKLKKEGMPEVFKR